MVFKFVVFSAFFAAAHAGAPIGFHQAHPHSTAAFAATPDATYAATAPVAHFDAAPVAHYAATTMAEAVLAEPYHPHAQYSFGYSVEDPLTGDSKNQQEHRDGDVVQGSYSLTDSDGFRRTVQYTADTVNGFNAVVHRQPLAAKVATLGY